MRNKPFMFEQREFLRRLFNYYLCKEHSLYKENIKSELINYKNLFDNVEKLPLTYAQRKAVLAEESQNLVIAGAGSGKTSVIVAKCAYILETKRAKEDEILVLAFNKNARDELMTRIKVRIGANIKAKTFHSLGYEIICASSQKAPGISNSLSTPKDLNLLINKTIEHMLLDKIQSYHLRSYLSEYIFPYVDEFCNFNSLADYSSWVSRSNLLTLVGEKVKSYGELIIGNSLFINGISYTYEAHYQSANHRPFHGAYRPDFHISGTNIYIEYYGIDREGKTAPFIDEESYHSSMNWKDRTHQEFGTILIKLHYYELKEESILDILMSELIYNQVKLVPISTQQILVAANKYSYLEKLNKLLVSVIGVVKANQLDIIIMSSMAKMHSERSSLFMSIFKNFYYAYQQDLIDSSSIDFNDMINFATDRLNDESYLHRYKYIIIDEYQDISSSRFNLVQALLKQKDKVRLFCVGDDWQAIYGFAGSQLKYMTAFRSKFKSTTAITNLDMTFRYDKTIGRVSANFITTNRDQIRKSLKTYNSKSGPSINIHHQEVISPENIAKLLLKIKSSCPTGATPSVLFLARYSMNLPNVVELKELWDTKIDSSTIHSSKGSEADYVIICDVISSKAGFPSNIIDDPVFELFSNTTAQTKKLEERRLFYVALTRAKKQVHLITTHDKPSSFIEQISTFKLFNWKNRVVHFNRKAARHKYACPECDSGIIKVSKKGNRYCSNIPHCRYYPPNKKRKSKLSLEV